MWTIKTLDSKWCERNWGDASINLPSTTRGNKSIFDVNITSIKYRMRDEYSNKSNYSQMLAYSVKISKLCALTRHNSSELMLKNWIKIKCKILPTEYIKKV